MDIPAIDFKNKVYQACLLQARQRLDTLNRAYAESREALASESKSTAGDKHETGRAMIQLEQEKMGRQFQENQKRLQMLERLKAGANCQSIAAGALVKLNETLYFVAAPLGRITVDEQEVFVLAPAAPFAQAALGKVLNDTFVFNQKTFRVSWIL